MGVVESIKPEGSLRRRALTTARGLLRRDGCEALNLRDIAAEAGSGLASLYYHFPDKDGLLAHLAIEGFHELLEALRTARENPGEGTPARACGLAFINFALAEPALYNLMFQSKLQVRHESVRQIAEAAFDVFKAAVDESGLAPEGALEPVSLALWAMVRGVSVVSLSGGAPRDVSCREVVEQAIAGVDVLLSRS